MSHAFQWRARRVRHREVPDNPILSANDEAPIGAFLLAERMGEKSSGSKKSSGTINIRYTHVAYPSGHHTKRDVQN